MDSPLAGRVVAVTGGARGLGLAIATVLARAGARVVLGDIDADLAGQAAARLGGVGRSLDVRNEASYRAFLTAAGELDVLVNNAGVVAAGAFLQTTAAEHALQLAVNVGGVERGMRLALPAMVARGCGHVVNIASAAGRIPAPYAAMYSATKHAVVGLTDAVRSELLGSGVWLTAVLPTAAHTDMAAGLAMRGLPTVAPEAVGRAVLRAVTRRRPPATVMVPRWLRPAAALDAISPQPLRDLVRRLATVRVPLDPTARADYEARISRQLDP